MKYLKIGHYRSTCLDYSELWAYFALIMILISKYGFCRSSVRNYANHYPNTLLCKFRSCHVSRLRCRNPAMCLSLKNSFQHPILLLIYGSIKNITNHYETFFHLFVMNSSVFLIELFFIWGTSRELIYYLDYFGACCTFRTSNTLVLYFAKIFILNHSYVIHIYD